MSRKCPTCRLTTGKKEWCLQHDKCKACCGCWRNYIAAMTRPPEGGDIRTVRYMDLKDALSTSKIKPIRLDRLKGVQGCLPTSMQ